MFNRGRAQKSSSFSKLSCIGLSSSGATLASDAYSGLTMNLMKPICECGREWPSREKPGETGKLSAASASPCAHGGRVRRSYGTGGDVERRAQGAPKHGLPSTGCAGLVYDGAAGHLREELLEHAVGPHLDVGVPLGKVAQVCGLDGQLEAEQLVVGLEVAQLEHLLGGARRAGGVLDGAPPDGVPAQGARARGAHAEG